MASGALFGNSSALGGTSGGSKHLVEFRAGRMSMKGRMVHPDKRKGFLYVYQSDDSLMHFCWKDRTTGTIEDDLIIFPDDCEFIRVSQCTTGRVYVLKFKSSSRKLFFWMQEPKTDKDEEHCRRINEVLNNPPAAGSSRGGGAPEGDLQNILNNMSQQQLMQLFGNVGQMGGLSSLLGTISSRPSTGQSSRASSVTPSSRLAADTPRAPSKPPRAESAAPAATATPATPTTPATPVTTTQGQTATAKGNQPTIHLSDLQRYLSGLTGSGPDAEAPASAGGASVELAAALASPEVVAAAATHQELQEHLPHATEDMDQDDVKTTLLSPQFAQQAASEFSSALSTGQLGPVLSQFGLGSEAVGAAQQGDVPAFFKAMDKDKEVAQNTSSTDARTDKDKPKPKPGKDDDESQMSVD